MRLLIDTQLLIWAVQDDARLPRAAATLLGDADTIPLFSPISLAEIAIKNAIGRPDFPFEAEPIRRALLANRAQELALTGDGAIRLASLPPIHKDPFDRLLVAQALAEAVPLVTTDKTLGRYPGQVIVV